jgi:hypothetical protein
MQDDPPTCVFRVSWPYKDVAFVDTATVYEGKLTPAAKKKSATNDTQTKHLHECAETDTFVNTSTCHQEAHTPIKSEQPVTDTTTMKRQREDPVYEYDSSSELDLSAPAEPNCSKKQKTQFILLPLFFET